MSDPNDSQQDNSKQQGEKQRPDARPVHDSRRRRSRRSSSVESDGREQRASVANNTARMLSALMATNFPQHPLDLRLQRQQQTMFQLHINWMVAVYLNY